MTSNELAPALCAQHAVAAVATCARCGRYVCSDCSQEELERRLCRECFARPEVRLVPSPRARRAVWMALLGFHGVLPLLLISFGQARAELRAIEQGAAPSAGRPFAHAALALSMAGCVLWMALGLYAAR